MKSIINFTKDAVENISHLDDWVDSHLEDIKDYTDTASDIISPVKSLFSIIRFVKSRKFKAFLNSYAKEIRENHGKISTEYSENLRKYLNNPRNLNMIYEGIEASINSNSVYSANCIGYIAGKQISGMYETNNKILILINAFKNLNDFELYSAINILKAVQDYTKPQNVNHLNVISIGTVSEYTIQKLKTLQVVDTTQNMKVTYIGAIDSGSFFMSDITEEFMDIIINSGTFEKMKKDYT